MRRPARRSARPTTRPQAGAPRAGRSRQRERRRGASRPGTPGPALQSREPCFLSRAAGMFASVHSALHSTPFQIAGNLTVLLAIVFWLGLAYWMYRDARRRIADPWLIGSAALLSVAVPYLGAVIYLLVRPPETLAEAHARELEVLALAQRLNRRDDRCPVCHAET